MDVDGNVVRGVALCLFTILDPTGFALIRLAGCAADSAVVGDVAAGAVALSLLRSAIFSVRRAEASVICGGFDRGE